MNICDAVVTEIKASPYKAYDKWWVKVEYDSWGAFGESAIMCNTYEEAAKIDVGYEFLV